MQPIPALARGVALGLMLASLPACQNAKPCPVKTQIVEVPVEVVVPVPHELTAKPAKPVRPANRCKDARGRATICNQDLASWLNSYDALVDKLFGQFDAIEAMQAKP